MPTYIDVILPFPLAGTFTYSLPAEWNEFAQIGCRVIVPFGKKKYYTAIITAIHNVPPVGYTVKDILDLLDSEPVLLPVQLSFWEWLSTYYISSLGDVYKAALPSGLKLESETRVEYNPEFETTLPLNEKEECLLDILSNDREQTIVQLEKKSGLKNILSVIKSLLEKGALYVKEELRKSYKPKTEIHVKLTSRLNKEECLNVCLNELVKAPKQLSLLLKFIELSGYQGEGTLKEVSRKELLSITSISTSILNSLVEKEIVELYHKEIGRLDNGFFQTIEINPLNNAQEVAFHKIKDFFYKKKICLLHGITSSGKTEIYIHLISEMVKSGKQVLYLLPEIALTTQITERLRRVFGSGLGIYHSKYPDAERVEVWKKQLSDEPYKVVLGVRSSLFLPFRNLGLIIVDEEHESSYKQHDPAPRYHARDAAIMLASMSGANVLLGTATPSIETYYNALSGKYGLVELTERYKEIQLPEIIPVDIQELARKKRMGGQFSPFLIEKMTEALDNGEQVILFQNRRGYAPMIECRVCGWIPKCQHCDVSLTYHKKFNQLTCHYCGYTYQLPRVCPACESTEMINRGFGTEKVEDDISLLFPNVSVARMDLDTTRTRTAYEKIINDFENKKVNILIGTQMISKGLDFDHVSVVGILNADTMLNFPDFRAYERAFQLMAQVSGRAGRKNKRGLVVLQTKSIDNPIIHQVITNNYREMYFSQLAERQMFSYPPFYRLIYVYLKHRNEEQLTVMAEAISIRLRAVFGNRILGPDNPPVGRVQSLYIKKIIIKMELNTSTVKVREQLMNIQREMAESEGGRSLMIYYDVDPV